MAKIKFLVLTMGLCLSAVAVFSDPFTAFTPGPYSYGQGIYTTLLENSPDSANDKGQIAFMTGTVTDGLWYGGEEIYMHQYSSLGLWAIQCSSWGYAYTASYDTGIFYCRGEMWPTELQTFFTRSY